MGGDTGTAEGDEPDDVVAPVRRSLRRKVALSAAATFVVLLAVYIAIGLRTNRIVAGEVYENVTAIPYEHRCLESGFSRHYIDAAGLRWYDEQPWPKGQEYWALGEGGTYTGRLVILTDVGGNAFFKPAMKRDVAAEFIADKSPTKYYFSLGQMGC